MIESTSPKLFESLRNLGGSILAMVQTRLELATVELAEERVRLMKIALYGLFGLLLFGLALITLTLLLIIVFWDSYRLHALVAIAAVYIVGGVICLLVARNLVKSATPLFEAALAELEKDRESLRK